MQSDTQTAIAAPTKHAGGRPPLFSNADDFDALATAYLIQIETVEKFVPTVNGLAKALGMTRETLLRYAEKPEFSDACKKARVTLEEWWEKRLADPACAGTIFWLKNQGWSDKVIQEQTGPNGTPLFPTAELTPEQIDARLAELAQEMGWKKG